MRTITIFLAALSLLLSGAISGFFYSYSSSVMLGLDAVEAVHAIRAMQGINAEVRNAVFFPAFFLTPVASLAAAGLLLARLRRLAAACFAASALVYFCGAFLPTLLVSVPMNEALATLAVPADAEAARTAWADYSVAWVWWNGLRTAFSFLALALSGAGVFAMGYDAGIRRNGIAA